ncbi:MBL fold metallo-hydrolase [Actinomadura montaniterrae]|uniref:MBL fold metallo-hydrolase n=1 Tax=Actinomadura montaniterrae TaxID=1803903 RepID=A0A6L3W8F0_9ACTN|nr:MBL fold metallo-hydrolase [Actinomadura montaniterrae]KAB2388102.1 MBL fold metallo-hydrolase [Actinomadura montaniterrae]
MVQPASRAQVRLGATTVTFLPDGHASVVPTAVFPASAPTGWATHSEFLDADGRLPISIGSFLVRTGDRVVLVDLGLGEVDFDVPGLASFKGGSLLRSLAAEGLAPEDVDTVVYTHLHHDHVGWTTDVAPAPTLPEGRVPSGLTFANARHLVAEAEWRHWKGTSEIIGPDAVAVRDPLADRVGFVADGQEIAPGVRVRATPGHAPGHQSLVVTGDGDDRRLIILGDVMHCQVQVAESRWGFLFDDAPEEALATRESLLADLEDERTLLAGGHFAGHVFGRVLPPVARRAWSSAA